jgi:hypothetical protein
MIESYEKRKELLNLLRECGILSAEFEDVEGRFYVDVENGRCEYDCIRSDCDFETFVF